MILPPLRFQEGHSSIFVIIQQGFQVGFEVVSVGLRIDESTVELDADLLEDCVPNF